MKLMLAGGHDVSSGFERSTSISTIDTASAARYGSVATTTATARHVAHRSFAEHRTADEVQVGDFRIDHRTAYLCRVGCRKAATIPGIARAGPRLTAVSNHAATASARLPCARAGKLEIARVAALPSDQRTVFARRHALSDI